MEIQFFATCLVDSFFPEIGEAAIKLLRSHGVRIHFPRGQTCCGQPAMNAGYWEQAREMAQYTIRVFEPSPDPIVIPSGSCAGMLRHGYEELFQGDPLWLARARDLSRRTFEFSEFLADVLEVQAEPVENRGGLAYHPSCHLTRGLGISDQPRGLLKTATAGSAKILETECCGFGGVFAIDHPELSAEMLERTIQRIARSEADFVVGCDVSCLMHIEGGLRKRGSPIRCAHLAQVLADEDLGLR